MVNAAAHEFAEVEEYLRAAEEITGVPYKWGRYDLLCLPPSFPYGGMENPCLTFVTPTVLAGDRSLAAVVAHEVSHSWTGNLLTNATWEHFWLNEGWTVWLERKIQARMRGAEWYDFFAREAQAPLDEAVAHYGPEHNFTKLVPTLADLDPDDSYSIIPYEKGFQLLHHLSTVVGERFEEFAGDYIRAFANKTLTSEDFRGYFTEWCASREIDSSAVAWDTWLYAPGPPPVPAAFSDAKGRGARALAARWLDAAVDAQTFGASDVDGWHYLQHVCFLDHLAAAVADGASLPADRLGLMDRLYALTPSRNNEIRLRWQRLCIALRAEWVVPGAVAFVKSQAPRYSPR